MIINTLQLKMNNKIIAQKLNKIAKQLLSVDFPNQKAMNDYLKQHPKADRKNHKVVEFKPKKQLDEILDLSGETQEEVYERLYLNESDENEITEILNDEINELQKFYYPQVESFSDLEL